MKLYIIIQCPHCNSWNWVVNSDTAPDDPTCFVCAEEFAYQEIKDYKVVLSKPTGINPLADRVHLKQRATAQDVIRWYFRGKKK